jgi:spermidine/putrescine transport system permease protein
MKVLLGILVVVVIYLWAPLALIFVKGLSWAGWLGLLENTEIHRSLGHSLLLASGTALIATVLGALTAFGIPALSGPARRLLGAGLIFPMVLPEIVLGLSFMVWFIQLGAPFGWVTLLAAHVAFSYSYATLVMRGSVDLVDWSLRDAARDLGANKMQVFRHALWPQIAPGVAASLVTCFTLSLDDFLISFFVKGVDQVTLPIQVFSMIRFKMRPEVYTLSAILFCMTLGTVLVTQIWLTRKLRSRPSL